MAFGPEAGLALVDDVARDRGLADHYLVPSVRGELLVRLGRRAEAQAELRRALQLTRNAGERRLLQQRLQGLGDRAGPRSRPPARGVSWSARRARGRGRR